RTISTAGAWSTRVARPSPDPKRSLLDVLAVRYLRIVARLSDRDRARLPDSAFAYIDSKGNRRLPINDESHVRNALARFDQVAFEDDAARERARKRLLNVAETYLV